MFLTTKSIVKRGYNFGNLQGASFSGTVETLPLPDKVIIPLKQGFSAETQCLVKKGDKVRRGQIIGRDDHTYSSPVHASINGVVEYFETFIEGQEPHFGVVIRREHGDERGFAPIPGAGSPDKTREEISEILYLAGVTALGSTGIPSFHHTSDIDLKDVKTLVVNGLSAEPFSLPRELLLSGKIKEFTTGLHLLMKLFDLSENIHVALNKEAPVVKELGSILKKAIVLHTFENRYPLDLDEVVTEITTGKRVPDGGTPSEVGAVVVGIEEILHVYEAVVLGKPLIDKVISLGGPGFKNNKLVNVAVGTPVEWAILGNIKEGIEERILVGGAMRGKPMEIAAHPVERHFSSLTILEENREREFLSFLKPGFSILSYSREFLSAFFKKTVRKPQTNLQGEKRPCIFCSYCEDICPRRLVPHIYSKMVAFDMAEEAIKYGMEACIECGLCSFACPSKIPLLENIMKGKKELEERGRWSHPIGLQKLDVEGKL